jgi:hypothetical protein
MSRKGQVQCKNRAGEAKDEGDDLRRAHQGNHNYNHLIKKIIPILTLIPLICRQISVAIFLDNPRNLITSFRMLCDKIDITAAKRTIQNDENLSFIN